MKQFVVLVEFQLKPGVMQAFWELIYDNARTSCRQEPDCLRFDVLAPVDQVDRVLLYEIYTNRIAFETHLQSAHFKRFAAQSAALVAAKTITENELLCEGSASQTAETLA